MLTPNLTSPEKVIQTALTSIGISLSILVILGFIITGVLGPHEAARATFPVLSLIRSVQVSRFLLRTEVFVIFAWGFGLFISVSTYLYCGAKGIATWLNLEDYRPLVFPMGVIWIFLSVHGFKNVFDLNKFLSPEIISPYYGFFFLFLPLFLLWSGYFLRLFLNKLMKG
jgi:spore germination protein KB